jgi:hypothetical protein
MPFIVAPDLTVEQAAFPVLFGCSKPPVVAWLESLDHIKLMSL